MSNREKFISIMLLISREYTMKYLNIYMFKLILNFKISIVSTHLYCTLDINLKSCHYFVLGHKHYFLYKNPSKFIHNYLYF